MFWISHTSQFTLDRIHRKCDENKLLTIQQITIIHLTSFYLELRHSTLLQQEVERRPSLVGYYTRRGYIRTRFTFPGIFSPQPCRQWVFHSDVDTRKIIWLNQWTTFDFLAGNDGANRVIFKKKSGNFATESPAES
jgi:hypothetical protein